MQTPAARCRLPSSVIREWLAELLRWARIRENEIRKSGGASPPRCLPRLLPMIILIAKERRGARELRRGPDDTAAHARACSIPAAV